VLAPYGNYRTYKIEGIDYNKSPASTFEKNGQEITFRDYYKKAYGYPVREDDQPLIITSIKKKVLGKGNVM
jgi:aubergine-like protein